MFCHQTIGHSNDTVTDTGSRNSKPASKECNRRCTQHKGLLQPHVHCSPKRWGLEAHHQPETPQPGKYRPAVCLPRGADMSTSKFPEISLARAKLSFLIPSFRPGNSPKSLYQDSTPSCSNGEKDGYMDHLSGRYLD